MAGNDTSDDEDHEGKDEGGVGPGGGKLPVANHVGVIAADGAQGQGDEGKAAYDIPKSRDEGIVCLVMHELCRVAGRRDEETEQDPGNRKQTCQCQHPAVAVVDGDEGEEGVAEHAA